MTPLGKTGRTALLGLCFILRKFLLVHVFQHNQWFSCQQCIQQRNCFSQVYPETSNLRVVSLRPAICLHTDFPSTRRGFPLISAEIIPAIFQLLLSLWTILGLRILSGATQSSCIVSRYPGVPVISGPPQLISSCIYFATGGI